MPSAKFTYPPNATEILPDHPGDRYRFPFKVRSSRGGSYIISYDNAPGSQYWKCSCPGCTFNGQCKHLDGAGLRGRKFGKQAMPEVGRVQLPLGKETWPTPTMISSPLPRPPQRVRKPVTETAAERKRKWEESLEKGKADFIQTATDEELAELAAIAAAIQGGA